MIRGNSLANDIKKKFGSHDQEEEEEEVKNEYSEVIIEKNSFEEFLSTQAYSIVIEGHSLDIILNSDENIKKLF